MKYYLILHKTWMWSTTVSFSVNGVIVQTGPMTVTSAGSKVSHACWALKTFEILLFLPCSYITHFRHILSSSSWCIVKTLSVLYLQTCMFKQDDSFGSEAVPAPAILKRWRFQLSKWFTCMPNNRKKSNTGSVKGRGRIINKVCWRALYP